MSIPRRPGWWLPVGSGAIGLLIAWLLSDGHATLVFLLAGVAGLCVAAVFQRGICIAILVLAAANGIPFVDASRTLTHSLTLEDAASLMLFALGAAWWLFGRRPDDISKARQMLSWVGALLLIWWLVTLLRSVSGQQESYLRAAHFGRDFLYFGLALLVLPRVRLQPRDLRALLGALIAGALVFAVGQILTSAGLVYVGHLIHYDKVAPELGLTRVYSPMADVVGLAVALCVSGALLAQRARERRICVLLALVFIAATAVQLTRARWIGLLVAVVVVTFWLAVRVRSSSGTVLRRRLVGVLAILVAVAIADMVAAPGGVVSGAVGQRALLTLTNIENGGGTLASVSRPRAYRSATSAGSGQSGSAFFRLPRTTLPAFPTARSVTAISASSML